MYPMEAISLDKYQ